MEYLTREFGTMTISTPIDEDLLNNPTLTADSVTISINGIHTKLTFTPDEVLLIKKEKEKQDILNESMTAANYIIQKYVNCFYDIEPGIKSIIEPQKEYLAAQYRSMLNTNDAGPSTKAHQHWNWGQYAHKNLNAIVKEYLYAKLKGHASLIPDLEKELLNISRIDHFYDPLPLNMERCELRDLIVLYDKWVNTEHTTHEFIIRQILSLIQC